MLSFSFCERLKPPCVLSQCDDKRDKDSDANGKRFFFSFVFVGLGDTVRQSKGTSNGPRNHLIRRGQLEKKWEI